MNNKTKNINFDKIMIMFLVAILAIGIIITVNKKKNDLKNKSVNNVIQGDNDKENPEPTNSLKPTATPKPKVEIPQVIYNLSGKVVELDKNKITFNAEIFYNNEKGDVSKKEEVRKALIDSSTNFTKLSFKDETPVEEKIEFKDLKVGDYVEIISDKDVSKAVEFNAIKVRIQP